MLEQEKPQNPYQNCHFQAQKFLWAVGGTAMTLVPKNPFLHEYLTELCSTLPNIALAGQ